MRDTTRAYYSKLQNRFVNRDEYFDDLLFNIRYCMSNRNSSMLQDNNLRVLITVLQQHFLQTLVH